MKVSTLKTVLSKAKDKNRVVVQCGRNVYETKSVDIAPSGNVFIYFNDWHDTLQKAKKEGNDE